ncbi:uncharacterized protein LY89DRAFT_23902 [Mollisia scopiformis]|uniref:Uncharacterized protein n=1 Tax=Mollisia scopiformis TaxID=149040 RepID=A0A194XWU0_MOLSC|nr:uncharacterized protein LY89DRAFT_23902 [Mollisia scopiformis]KUJ24509.1 hypothetical protein LY89DRAFT_23902 [Mollisia scopiformis]
MWLSLGVSVAFPTILRTEQPNPRRHLRFGIRSSEFWHLDSLFRTNCLLCKTELPPCLLQKRIGVNCASRGGHQELRSHAGTVHVSIRKVCSETFDTARPILGNAP